MYQYKYVFAQLTSFLNRSKFNRIVTKYEGDKYVKHFTCWNQLLTLMFGQLSNRESLRDLIIAIEAHHQKCYHLGIGKHVTRRVMYMLLIPQPFLSVWKSSGGQSFVSIRAG